MGMGSTPVSHKSSNPESFIAAFCPDRAKR